MLLGPFGNGTLVLFLQEEYRQDRALALEPSTGTGTGTGTENFSGKGCYSGQKLPVPRILNVFKCHHRQQMAVFCVVHKMSELHCTVIVHSHLIKNFEDNFAAISRDRFQLQK